MSSFYPSRPSKELKFDHPAALASNINININNNNNNNNNDDDDDDDDDDKIGNSVIYTMNSNYGIAATLYSLQTWYVSGIQV